MVAWVIGCVGVIAGGVVTTMATQRPLPPRLVTGDEHNAAASGIGTGPSVWLIGLTVVVLLVTAAWWAWWGVMYLRWKHDPEERAFRRLASVVGLGPTDRRLLRRMCDEAGVPALAALGSPQVASRVLEGLTGDSRRIRRMRSKLCDTSGIEAGT